MHGLPSWWRVPVGAWDSEACFVVGGGPSFDRADAPRLRKFGRVIAVNAAYRVAPEADVCLWADRKWYDWQAGEPEWDRFGGLRVSANQHEIYGDPRIKHIRQSIADIDLSDDPGIVVGRSSGAMALNLAYLYGCNPIYLLGFDMRPNGNWHDWHKLGNRQGYYDTLFVPKLEAMGRQLLARGVRVVNCCKTSAVEVFPKANLGDILT